MAAETESGFLIDGKVYEVPDMGSFDMAERRLMFDLTGFVQEDFVQEDDETDDEHEGRVARMTRHPGFMEMLMRVAYQRGNPGVNANKVKLVVDKTNYLEAVQSLAGAEEEDAGPPASMTEPEQPSPRPTDLGSSSSGERSANGSGEQDDSPAPTGTTRLDTSYPVSITTGSPG